MFTTGSKLLIGSTVIATLAAVAYGIAQGGALGTIGLITAASALAVLAGLNLFVRDSNVSAMDHESFDSSAAAQATARSSPWPLVVALGATTVTLGLVTTRAFFIVGMLMVIVGAIEWMVQGWSERASGEQAYNADARDVMADPLETPIIAAVAGAVVVYAFSRVMLGLPSKTATVIAFAVVATVVLIAGAIVGFKRTASKVAMAGAFSVATVALIGVGTFAGLNGEREIEEHHSTAYIAAEDECGTEETEADENASNTVANTSNLAAEVTYDGSELSAELPGLGGGFDSITLPRSNPSNVLFRNNSGHHARLVIELHESESVEVSEGGEGEEVEDGEHGPTERLCTALVDDGGVQLLTIVFDRPSIAVEGGYELTVPGSDASVEVVVP